MKVLQINCVYGRGSTGKITEDIHRYLLAQGVKSVVVYGRGEKTDAPGAVRLCPDGYGKVNNLLSRLRGTMYGGCHFSTWRLIRILEKERPDVVHLQCINGYFVNIYRLVAWLKQRGIKTVVTLHAEFLYTANCGYALDCEKWRTGCGSCPRWRQETKSWFRDGTAWSYRKMEQAFRGFSKDLTVVSVSPWLRRRAETSPILREMPHRVILNGVDTQVFCSRQRSKRKDVEKVVFHATSQFRDDPAHIKGGWYVLELARRMKGLPVHFVVAGNYRICREVPENVTLLGEITDQKQLAEQYSAADVTLLTSRKETFSMVCAESLCCGTPVVGFRAGAPEEIAIPEYSTFVPFGDVNALESAVKRWLFEETVDKRKISAAGEKRYSRQRMAEEYMEIYRGLTHEGSH